MQFKRIEEIEGMSANTLLDILGILESVGDFATLTLKNATEQTKRSIVLKDNSNRSIELTLWGEFASVPGDQLAQVGLSSTLWLYLQCAFSGLQVNALLLKVSCRDYLHGMRYILQHSKMLWLQSDQASGSSHTAFVSVQCTAHSLYNRP